MTMAPVRPERPVMYLVIPMENAQLHRSCYDVCYPRDLALYRNNSVILTVNNVYRVIYHLIFVLFSCTYNQLRVTNCCFQTEQQPTHTRCMTVSRLTKLFKCKQPSYHYLNLSTMSFTQRNCMQSIKHYSALKSLVKSLTKPADKH